MTVEIPAFIEINQALIKQLNEFSLEQWMLYIENWPLPLLVLVNLALEKPETQKFWLETVARMQFDKELEIETLILATVEQYALEVLLDAIELKLLVARSSAEIRDFTADLQV